ncbi:DUF3422 domain-containing protein, partial [Rubrimonas sp.]|uniref:DUF3422 domain-containing protein n=1 Tax=Rubrimonas sp. TaxID=2036015 RepID=UPI002FDCF48B
MSLILPPDHPQRYPMTRELHARPFPEIASPSQAIHLAFKPLDDRARDTAAHRAHVEALVDRVGAPRPARDADHYFGEVGRVKLKWERHTEFVSYTLFEDGPTDAPFALPVERLAPADWLAEAPGALISAIRVHVETVDGLDAAEAALLGRLNRHFVAESLAAAHVVDRQATAFSDFRIHEDGFSRVAVLAQPDTGRRRVGRVVQRMLEIETYRMMAMLALPMARRVGGQLSEIEAELAGLIEKFTADAHDDRDALARLTRLSAAIEAISAETAFRFGASFAYSKLVEQRMATLREERAANRQMISEFMARRFEPAMRTCRSTERRLHDVANRADRAVSLLRTRVNVAVETQ